MPNAGDDTARPIAAVPVYGDSNRPFFKHSGMARAFPGGRMTPGVITPWKASAGPVPTLVDQPGDAEPSASLMPGGTKRVQVLIEH